MLKFPYKPYRAEVYVRSLEVIVLGANGGGGEPGIR